MSDLSTSMMLLLHKASRKIRKNGLHLGEVEQWLLEACRTYTDDGADGPRCCVLVMDADPEADAAFAIALIDKDDLVLTAGKGEKSAVSEFAAQAVEARPANVITDARKRFNVESRELSIHRDDMVDWAPETMRDAGLRGTSYPAAKPGEAIAIEPVHAVDHTLAEVLARVAGGNVENLLSFADIKEWLLAYLKEFEEELEQHPEERDEPHWDLLAADWRYDEDAVFCIALFDGDLLRLAVGRGAGDAVRDHGEDEELREAREIIALARTKFQVDDEELTISGTPVLSDWLRTV